jgi:predicted nucleotidyltransferase
MTTFDVALWGSATFPRVLAALLREPDHDFSFADLVRLAGANRESVHRALRRALTAGLVSRRRVGNQFVYRARMESPILAEMAGLMAKTHGTHRLLTEALAAAGSPQVEMAFLFGSTVRGTGHSDSDIDLMVLGSATRIDVARILAEPQLEVGQRINALAYTREEVIGRLDDGDAFFLEVWAQPKVMLIGTEGELPVARAASGPPS